MSFETKTQNRPLSRPTDILGASVGYEYSFFQNPKTNQIYHGSTVFAGVSAPIPAELHGEIGYSSVYGFNVYKVIEKIYIKIVEW